MSGKKEHLFLHLLIICLVSTTIMGRISLSQNIDDTKTFQSEKNLIHFISTIANLQFQESKLNTPIPQPLNHDDPDAEYFLQRVHIRHVDPQKPTVIITEGHSFQHHNMHERTDLLSGNEIRVEHGYFGESIPDSMDWYGLE